MAEDSTLMQIGELQLALPARAELIANFNVFQSDFGRLCFTEHVATLTEIEVANAQQYRFKEFRADVLSYEMAVSARGFVIGNPLN